MNFARIEQNDGNSMFYHCFSKELPRGRSCADLRSCRRHSTVLTEVPIMDTSSDSSALNITTTSNESSHSSLLDSSSSSCHSQAELTVANPAQYEIIAATQLPELTTSTQSTKLKVESTQPAKEPVQECWELTGDQLQESMQLAEEQNATQLFEESTQLSEEQNATQLSEGSTQLTEEQNATQLSEESSQLSEKPNSTQLCDEPENPKLFQEPNSTQLHDEPDSTKLNDEPDSTKLSEEPERSASVPPARRSLELTKASSVDDFEMIDPTYSQTWTCRNLPR